MAALKYEAGVGSCAYTFLAEVFVIESLVRVFDVVRFEYCLDAFRYGDRLVDVLYDTALSDLEVEFGARLVESAGNLRFPAESAPKLRFSLDSPTPNRFPGSKSSDCFCFFSISDVVCCSKKFVGGLGVKP